MTTLTEVLHAGGYIQSESNGTRSRETGTLISGQDLIAGTVLGLITASSKLTQHDQDGADGSEVAYGILHAAVDASGGDADCVITRRDTEVTEADLTWQADINAGEKTTAVAELAALGIISRASVTPVP